MIQGETTLVRKTDKLTTLPQQNVTRQASKVNQPRIKKSEGWILFTAFRTIYFSLAFD
jgi:hypothetical protein